MEPLTQAQEMGCLHRYMHWRLYRIDGEPRVLKRWTEKRTDKKTGKLVTKDREEWGGLDGNHMTDACRAEMKSAWADWNAWTTANT